MEFISNMGTLQLNRTDPAHLGTSPLLDTSKPLFRDENGNQSNEIPAEKRNKSLFESYLMDAVTSMNQDQVNLATLQQQVVMDPESVEAHQVTAAMAKAEFSLSLAQTVIDRLVTGWTELSQNR